MAESSEGQVRPSDWLEATRQAVALRRYSARTEAVYLGWLARYLRFRARRNELDDVEVLRQFLSHLASRGGVSASTQKQALSAIKFAFTNGLGRPFPWLEGYTPAYRPPRLPTVLSVSEVEAVLRHIYGAKRLIAMLLYGSGLRLLEAL